MSRTIMYYNVFLTLNGEKTSIKLTDLIDRVYGLNDLEKLWRYKNLSLLYRGWIDTDNPLNSDNRSFAIAKYRDNYRPYTGVIGTNIANPINQDVIEFTCCVYIRSSHQLLIEYNHEGSRPNDIAKYLSSFLPKATDANWDICLEPVDAVRGLADLRNANKINSIEFKIDCTQEIPEFHAENFFSNFFRRTVESHMAFGANVATIKFGNGKKRLDIIEAQTLIQMIGLLNLEEDIISSVKVEYVSDSNKKENIDLKNGSIMKEIIMEGEQVNGYEYIVQQIEMNYVLKNKPGSLAYRRFNNLIRNYELPRIIPHTHEITAANESIEVINVEGA